MSDVYVPALTGRYVILSPIGQGGMGSVFRASDRLTANTVALKSLVFDPEVVAELSSVGHDLRLTLAREFALLATLRHPNIISVLDYGFDRNGQPFYTMEFLAEAQNVVAYAQGRSAAEQEALFLQMIQALSYLHRRGVLHRDLKPDNVLVSGDVLKLLDFGLAIAREQSTEDSSWGTLAYQSPEVLAGGMPDERSDLFAVGLITYQMFSGQYPFDVSHSPNDLARNIRHKTLDLTALDLSPAMAAVLARLLEKDPARRYTSADDVLTAYERISDMRATQETPILRESFLQAAQFIGREQEIAQVTSAMDAMIAGLGSAWLIGGESGVGKSRFLNELRTQALVRGALVLKAQAVAESGALFRLWREPVRQLLLLQPISDFEAGVLKTIIPDIEVLLRRSVSPAPDIDPKAARDRITNTIEALFLRYTAPIVLILEDLHWVKESVGIIERLSRNAAIQPLLIIGSYRDDDAPQLPTALPEMTTIKLSRLRQGEISDLSASMLGENSGRRADLVKFLMEQTEGNVFFIVETVRALAEEVGQLQAIGSVALPENIIASGVRNVVQRRLSQIGGKDRQLLDYAALSGRELDLPILTWIAPTMSVNDWLVRCASVFEAQGDKWRFAHDKLREGAIAAIPEPQLPTLFREIATATEQIYGDDPDHYITQADQWQHAGDAFKETRYSALAGAQLLKQGEYTEAMQRLKRAYELAQTQDWSPLWRARLARSLADACIGMGDQQGNIRFLQEALTHLNPDNLPDIETVLTIDETRLLTEIELELGYNYIELTTDPLIGQQYILHAAALQERMGQLVEQADCYAMLSMILTVAHEPQQAAAYAGRAAEILNAIAVDEVSSAPAILARALSNLAYYWTFAARWQESIQVGERAATTYEQIGDLIRWRGALMNIAASYEWQGDFQRGMKMRLQEYEIARRGVNITGQIRALAGVGQLHAYLGDLDEARQALEHRSDLVSRVVNSSSTRFTYLSMVYFRSGMLAAARENFPRAVDEIGRIKVPTAHDMFSISDTAEALLGLWENDLDHAVVYQDAAPAVMLRVQMYAERYLSGEPLMRVFWGWYLWLQGDHDGAKTLWAGALVLANERGTQYSAALAHYEIGRHLPVDDVERMTHLKQAVTMFASMGTRYHQALAEKALTASQ